MGSVPTPPGRPWVLVNVAMTADGKIDTIERSGARISSSEDIAAVDGLRADVDAVIVGGATFISEDPRLTVRDPAHIARRRAAGKPDQPAKVAIVSTLPGSPAADSRYILDGGGAVMIFTTERSSATSIDAWRGAGAEIVVMGVDRVDLGSVLAELRQRAIEHVLVEGGGTLMAALFAADLADEFRQYVAPFVVGGRDAPTPLDGEGMPGDARVDLELVSTERLGPGIALRYRVARAAG